MPKLNMQVVHLTTRVTNDGDQCVRRDPPIVRAARKDLDVIRLSNGNAPDPDGGADITITVAAGDAASLLDPVPLSPIKLAPGASVDWTLKSVLSGPTSLNYRTDPDNCEGHDQGDVVIQC
jgi:hypothetical protein